MQPDVVTSRRGRPPNSSSTRRDPSAFEYIGRGRGRRGSSSRSSSRGRSRGRSSDGVRGSSSLGLDFDINLDAGVGPAVGNVSTGVFPWVEELPWFMHPHVVGWWNVEGDGNCGFRVVADAFFGNENNWYSARKAMYNELVASAELYYPIYGDRYEEAKDRINLNATPAPEFYWMEAINDLFIIATLFNVAVVFINTLGVNHDYNFTILPLKAPPGSNGPVGQLYFGLVQDYKHFIRLYMHPASPLPPLPTLWTTARHQSVDGWEARYETRMSKWPTRRSGSVHIDLCR